MKKKKNKTSRHPLKVKFCNNKKVEKDKQNYANKFKNIGIKKHKQSTLSR